MDGTDCDICFHHYDDQTHLPRTLPCGHTLCTSCITEAIKNDKMTCPYCRTSHNISAAKDISITFALLNISLSRSVSKADDGSSPTAEAVNSRPLQSAKSMSSIASLVATEPDVHAGVCMTHRSYKLFYCCNCLVWICRDCSVVDHPVTTCVIVSIHQALKNLKDNEEVLFSNNREAYMKHLEFLREYQKKLGDCAEKHEMQETLLQALNASHSGTINLLKKEKERVEDSLKEAEVALSRMDAAKEHLTKMNTVESVECTRKELQIRSKILNEWISGSKDDILKAGAIQMSDELSLEIKMMLISAGYGIGNPLADAGFFVSKAKQMLKERISIENIQSLVATHQVWAVTKDCLLTAPLVYRNGHLHLHSLRKTPTPPDVFTLPYDNVRHLVKQSSQAFVELSWSNKVQGYLYFTFGDNEDLHTSLTRRCLGEIQPCFNASFVHLHTERRNHNISQFYVGIHQNTRLFRKASGSPSLINPGNGVVTLGLSNGQPCFVIWFKPHTQTYIWSDVQIGRLTKGIELIESVAANGRVSEVRVTGSGLVLV